MRNGRRALRPVEDDRHAVEAAVQQQQPGLRSRLAHQEQQLLEFLLEALRAHHGSHGQGEPLALEDQVGGGVGEERVGPALGLGAVDLAALQGVLAVIGQEGQVDAEAERPLAQGGATATGRWSTKAALTLHLSSSRQKRLAYRALA